MGAIISGGIRKIGIVAPNRIVRACNRSTGALVEQTTSDIVGNYTFQNLDTGVSYYVYALDETFNQYNAAIADVLKPKPLFSFTGTATGTVSNSSTSDIIFNITKVSSATADVTASTTITYNMTAEATAGVVAGAGASSYTVTATGIAEGLVSTILPITSYATGVVLVDANSSNTTDINYSNIATVLVDANSSTTTDINYSNIATVLVDAASSTTTDIIDSATGTVV